MRLFLVSFLFAFNAYSFVLIPANSHLCGEYKVMIQNRVMELPVLDPAVQKHSNDYIWLRYALNQWLGQFQKNGDKNVETLALCYGVYDDKNSTGENSVAIYHPSKIIKHTLLMGRKNLDNLKNNPKQYIQNRLKQEGQAPLPESMKVNFPSVVSAIFYHELGHVLQNVVNNDINPNNNLVLAKDWRDKPKELHADCVSSVFFGMERLIFKSPNLNFRDDLDSARMLIFAIGDKQFYHQGHHGTYEERLAAFNKGTRITFNAIIDSREKPLELFTTDDILQKCAK